MRQNTGKFDFLYDFNNFKLKHKLHAAVLVLRWYFVYLEQDNNSETRKYIFIFNI